MHTFCSALKTSLSQRITQLEKIISDTQKVLPSKSTDSLYIRNSHGRTQYYRCPLQGNNREYYMSKRNMSVIRKLAQSQYDRQVLELAQQELKILKQFLAVIPTESCEDYYETKSSAYKDLVIPVIPTDAQYLENWYKDGISDTDFRSEQKIYSTNRGEYVRSKSEVIIANELDRKGIPYKYEASLYLSGMGTIHPDFTVLNIHTRKQLYWEHFGLIDDRDYRESALHKLICYEHNDIYPGKNLIITMETEKTPLNTPQIRDLIDRYLT